MALNNIHYYIIAVAIFLIGIFGFMLFGEGLDHHDKVNLDSDSEEYISKFTGKMNDTGFTTFVNETSATANQTNPFSSSLDKIPVLGEIFGVVSLIINIVKGVWNFAVLMFNIPSFILSTIGLPIVAFSFIVNIITYAIIISLIVVFVGLIK